MNQSSGSGLGRLLGSPAALLIVVLGSAIVLWLKLDGISHDLAAGHRPDQLAGGESVSVDPHAETPSQGQPVLPSSGSPHPHGPFQSASHPPGGRLTLVPEWEPVRFVALALPSIRVSDGGYLRLLADVAQPCLRMNNVDMIVVIEQNDVAARVACEAMVRERKLDAARVRLCEVGDLDSIWLRDYGPIFIRRPDDRSLFILDTGYRDVRLGLHEGGIVQALGVAPTLRPADDLVPLYFSVFLGMPCVHPGLSMNGGDLYGDGAGLMYTSEETIHLNGGDRSYLAEVFRGHFGVVEVRYLRPLPGPTVKHIDMFFKLASRDTCLVGQYRTPQGQDDLACLQRGAAITLEENARRLAQHGLRVVRMPMPDLTKLSQWDYYGKIFSPKDRDKRVAALAVGAEVSTQEMTERLRSQYTYVYRTFLNSVLVVSPPSPAQEKAQPPRGLLLVPRHPLRADSGVEKEVEAVYRSVYGEGVEVVFVDAETLAPSNGSLRCVVITVPAE